MLNSTLYLNSIGLRRSEVPSFSDYPFSLPAVRNLREIRLTSPVTFLVGENGSGKSTLLEAVASSWGFNPEGGSRNMMFATRPSESGLHEYLALQRGLKRPGDGFFLRAESFFNVATAVDEMGAEALGPYGGVSLHERSHGESFLALAGHRFFPNGFYVLDEPEAALSVRGQLALLRRMWDLVSQGCQFLVATHSPILTAFPEATIYHLSDEGIAKVAYDQTDQYRLTRDFLEEPGRFLRHLLSDDD